MSNKYHHLKEVEKFNNNIKIRLLGGEGNDSKSTLEVGNNLGKG